MVGFKFPNIHLGDISLYKIVCCCVDKKSNGVHKNCFDQLMSRSTDVCAAIM